MKKRYAIIGLSGRSRMFTRAIMNTYGDQAEIVALLDSNEARMTDFKESSGLDLPCYGKDDFARLAEETGPDAVIISTTDATHHKYIIAALERDIEAITEKPMTTDEDKVKAILAAEKKSKAGVRVTFNYRYTAIHTKIKEMMMDGAVGRATQVDFNYYLDTLHGASYFKRWNRYEAEGGSLLVTKACHHFDLVNWWLDCRPVEVFAFGRLNYYGPDGPANPEKKDGRRCSKCADKCIYYLRHAAPGGGSQDEHLVNFNNPGKNEKFGAVDGYYADRCIFDSDIDTWDTFAVTVLYEHGIMMSYSLNASMPYEGYRLAINGTAGRIETDSFSGSGLRLPFPPPPPRNIRYFPLFDGRQTIEVLQRPGGHGGGDPVLERDLFLGRDKNDRANHVAGAWEGAMSVLIGVAARKSLKSGQPVRISDLLK